MDKLTCIVSCPIDVLAGYGSRARDFVRSLIKIKDNEWDIKIISMRWGTCPYGALNPEKPEDKNLLDRIINPQTVTQQPDIWIQISVSNEFQAVGKVNIGVSALVETNLLPAEMLTGLNNMTFNIVSSKHAKSIAEAASFDQIDNRTQQVVQKLKLIKPVEVLFEGVDTEKYFRTDSSTFDLGEVNEQFCFLSVGHWLQGDPGEDRKNISGLVKIFLEAFKNKKKKPALILKTSLAGYSVVEEEELLNKIDAIRKTVDSKDLPNIYLLHGELTDEEMNQLYNHPKIKAFALFSNEGFGRPFLEFSVTGKPVICSPWSGHIDFLNPEFAVYVGGNLQQVHPSAVNQFILKEAQWFKVSPPQAAAALRDVYENYKDYEVKGKRQGYRSKTEFSLHKMTEKLNEILTAHMPEISKPITITLPKLNRMELPVDIEEEIAVETQD